MKFKIMLFDIDGVIIRIFWWRFFEKT